MRKRTIAVIAIMAVAIVAAYLAFPSVRDFKRHRPDSTDAAPLRERSVDLANRPKSLGTGKKVGRSEHGDASAATAAVLIQLYTATNAKAIDDAAQALGVHDVDGVHKQFVADGFCANGEEYFSANASYEDLVRGKGGVEGRKARETFNYVKERFGKFCDPSTEYGIRMLGLVQRVNALDTSATSDFQIYARARDMSAEQREQFAKDLYDIASGTDSPRTFALVADLLVGIKSADYLGADLFQDTGLEKDQTTIQGTAIELAYCQLAGNCDQPDSIDAISYCWQLSVCHPGITYRSALQENTTPQQFEIAQQIAQRLLRSRTYQ